ncbi:TIGR01777 family oxidoreductase [Luteimonas sp. Y-2-2-4F]|nr:TIGR01777 family oxidoreductase [Luteimonas sp. Y-2-2-4F]MCD9030629.1 TIGR01777 family oxidoreductase [Luteimonas sp. Y-2-2-4F]
MRILISGGSGFLGRALSRALLERGDAPVWLSRDPSSVAPPAAVPARHYDTLGADDAFDAVVNLAGAGIAERRWGDARKQELFDSRLVPTRRLVAWMRRAKARPRVLLSGSAVGWYGRQPPGAPALDERSEAHDEFVHALCAQWERAALEAVPLGVPVTLLRTGVVLHPEGGMLQRLLPAFRRGLGARLGDGRQVLSWVSREDWVDAVLALLDQHLARAPAAMVGPVNLCAPEAATNAEFTRSLAAAVGRPARLGLSATLLRLAFGEMSTLLLDGQRVSPARLLAAGHRFRHPNLDALLAPAAM